MHAESWCSLTDQQLGMRDVAEVNLAAAFGLPHAGHLDIPACRTRLDEWAEFVRTATRRLRCKFARSPQSYGGTSARFKMLVLVTVLQRDLRVRYNHEFADGEYDASDSRNLFLHGILTGHGGTCVTMPVLYAAIGRRLGLSDSVGPCKGAHVLPLGRTWGAFQHRGHVQVKWRRIAGHSQCLV